MLTVYAFYNVCCTCLSAVIFE